MFILFTRKIIPNPLVFADANAVWLSESHTKYYDTAIQLDNAEAVTVWCMCWLQVRVSSDITR